MADTITPINRYRTLADAKAAYAAAVLPSQVASVVDMTTRPNLLAWAKELGCEGVNAHTKVPELQAKVTEALQAELAAADASPEPEAPEAPTGPMTAEAIMAAEKAKAGKAPKAKAATTRGPRAAAVGRYAEAMAVRKAANDKRPEGGVKLSTAELATTMADLQAEAPYTMGQALEVAYWLGGVAVSRSRWAAVWATLADLQAEAEAGPEATEPEAEQAEPEAEAEVPEGLAALLP